jgi:hypothetical protein
MVEHRPVKALVAGSSPASGAIEKAPDIVGFFFNRHEVSEPNRNTAKQRFEDEEVRRSLLRGLDETHRR